MINQMAFNSTVYSSITCNGKAYMFGSFTTVAGILPMLDALNDSFEGQTFVKRGEG